MEEFQRILLECRYLLSLNKNYHDLAIIFGVSENKVYNDLNFQLPKYDQILYERVKSVLNIKNSA